MKISNKAIIIGKGDKCPKCSKEMDRRKHPPHWKHIKSYYYTEWDYCESCKHVQHYDKFKSTVWQEEERQESFFRDLKNGT